MTNVQMNLVRKFWNFDACGGGSTVDFLVGDVILIFYCQGGKLNALVRIQFIVDQRVWTHQESSMLFHT